MLTYHSFIGSRTNEDAILVVQVFDQKKFKKKDQGFLGVINVRIGDVIELADGADGKQVHSNRPRRSRHCKESSRAHC